ncbi:hypothetical protein C8F04DRAFT_1265354 [Mycena alexandri]|uniref:Uncharacterized protein n=1 Tax=Mycena alexandri TaxID=1745969 RepID=A0AAD6SK81_9AGAR|nr:hypothetical protein C8F04DRAFT_1265354 [Mycena alexandri]
MPSRIRDEHVMTPFRTLLSTGIRVPSNYCIADANDPHGTTYAPPFPCARTRLSCPRPSTICASLAVSAHHCGLLILP